MIRYAVVFPLFLVAPLHAEEKIDYLRDVKPILALKCYACHGALKQKAKLRLDTGALIRKGGRHGPAIVAGKPDESLLLAKVVGKDETLMPPEGLGEKLDPEQVATLRRWVAQGAVAPDEAVPPDPRQHWAYQPPKQVAFGSGNPIDRHLAAKQAEAGVNPVELADKATLLRRVYLDLIGVPPSRKELHRFLDNKNPYAYEHEVEKLLAHPGYGERWGRHWMDVWRYSDWSGYRAELRNSQKHIWHWRDWIVESLNEDKGYDRMILEMLAADELSPTDRDALRATGFLARHYYKFNRHMWMDTVLEHTCKAFLGVTINCAKCHDHKYDPLPQVSYYELRAVFEPYDVRLDPVPGQLDPNKDGIPRIYDAHAKKPTFLFERGNEKHPVKDKPLSPKVPEVLGGKFTVGPMSLGFPGFYPEMQTFVTTARREQMTKAIEAAQAKKDVNTELGKARLESAKAEKASYRARVLAEFRKYSSKAQNFEEAAAKAASAEREANWWKAKLAVLEKTNAVEAAKKAKPGPKSKANLAKAEKELANAKKQLATAEANRKKTDSKYSPVDKLYPQQSTGRRTALARWITHRDNPLTARVAVNHVWMRHFGTPLVENVFDFGLRSAKPEHAELLDWLAVDFVKYKWSLKHLHRVILMSKAYRRRSDSRGATEETLEADPDNRLLWRMNPLRMEAEVVRDSVLAVAGSLDTKRGGPDIPYAQGLTTPRRSIYFQHAYEKKVKFLELFDGANEEDCYRRSVSVMPQQALALANSTLSIEQSRILAKKLSTEAKDDAAFVVVAFETVLSRPPTAKEAAVCRAFLAEQAKTLAEPTKLTPSGGVAKSRVPPAKEPGQRARENLVHVLFNHNDFVTIR